MTTTKKPRRFIPRTHNDTDPVKTGRIIRQLRINKAMTQEELATAAGYKHHHSIARIESGSMPIPDAKLAKVAAHLGVPAHEIRRTDLAEYGTVADIAEHYGVADRVIRQCVRDGSIPAIRVGARVIRIRWTDAEKAFSDSAVTEVAR
jgi:excisionase family DNA binding protein